jgi:hypothetical protein
MLLTPSERDGLPLCPPRLPSKGASSNLTDRLRRFDEHPQEERSEKPLVRSPRTKSTLDEAGGRAIESRQPQDQCRGKRERTSFWRGFQFGAFLLRRTHRRGSALRQFIRFGAFDLERPPCTGFETAELRVPWIASAQRQIRPHECPAAANIFSVLEDSC